MGTCLLRRLSLKGRAEVCTLYVFPLILYRLAVLPLPKARRLALQRPLSRLLCGGQRPMNVDRSASNVRATGVRVCLIWFAERLAYLGRFLTRDAVWRRKVNRTFPRLQSDSKAEGRRKPMGKTPFVCEC